MPPFQERLIYDRRKATARNACTDPDHLPDVGPRRHSGAPRLGYCHPRPGHRADCEKIVAAACRSGRDNVGCIIPGRGEDDKKVHEGLTAAAGVPGFIGFAVGRTAFWEPLVGWRAGKTSREATVAEIARHYREFVDIFEQACAS